MVACTQEINLYQLYFSLGGIIKKFQGMVEIEYQRNKTAKQNMGQ